MKVKSLCAVISGLVLIILSAELGGIYLSKLDVGDQTVIITVIWDTPDSECNDSKTSEPLFVEVYSLPEGRRDRMYLTSWDFEKIIFVAKQSPNIYTGQGNFSFQSNLIYIVKVPESINKINFVDNLTAVEIDKSQQINDLTIHFWETQAVAWKPVIYLYNTENVPFKDTISVTFPYGSAIKTIPDIPLGQEITWENVEVYPVSQIQYNGEYYPYLFYEASIDTLEVLTFERGWVIQNIGNCWTVNGEMIEDLKDFFSEALLELGLFEDEITDFVEYWCDEIQLFTEEGTYIFRQIPLGVVNENFQLETTHFYSMIRVMFTFSYTSETENVPELLSPIHECSLVDSEYILHEWGIIF